MECLALGKRATEVPPRKREGGAGNARPPSRRQSSLLNGRHNPNTKGKPHALASWSAPRGQRRAFAKHSGSSGAARPIARKDHNGGSSATWASLSGAYVTPLTHISVICALSSTHAAAMRARLCATSSTLRRPIPYLHHSPAKRIRCLPHRFAQLPCHSSSHTSHPTARNPPPPEPQESSFS